MRNLGAAGVVLPDEEIDRGVARELETGTFEAVDPGTGEMRTIDPDTGELDAR